MPKFSIIELLYKNGSFVSIGAGTTYLAPQQLTKSQQFKSVLLAHITLHLLILMLTIITKHCTLRT